MIETKKYNVIYADPPWRTKAGPKIGGYKTINGTQVWNQLDNKSRDLTYKTMSVEEIKKLPIQSLCATDCHLYLWTTNGYLPKAFDVIESWGFKYSTTLVWAKNAMGGGLGGNYRITTEFLLFATRGSLRAKEQHKGTWFNYRREYDERGKPQHSRKPAAFMEIIEKVSPGPYLELFARRQRDGWDVYGNEVTGSILLTA